MKSKISNLMGGLAFLVAGLVASVPAQAVSLGVDFSLESEQVGTINFWNLGWSFTANSNVTVVRLGNWFGGFFRDQQVGLWDSAGNLLASTFVSNNGINQLVGSAPWLFNDIAPVQLTAGDTYVVGGQGGAPYTFGVPNPTFDPRISYISDLFTFIGSGANSPLREPVSSQGPSVQYGWFGGNIELADAPVPLPAALPLFASGLVGMGWLARRKKRMAAAKA